MHSQSDLNIAIIGLGYVGLPLAVEFAKNRSVLGFDINNQRINELLDSIDSTLEVSSKELIDVKNNLSFSSNSEDLKNSNCFIVTVPTPIDNHKQPDLRPLISASETVAKYMPRDSVIIYESTVYPGATEEICIPILEKNSGMSINKEFFVGYSPERINPGDKEHRLPNIMKITSGSTKESANLINDLYQSIIKAGTHLASSIKVAEAAKVIENTQRDINIGLVNELALIFNRLGIDTEEVLKAAGTKWNFLNFKPGLVGGHCIGVDPYYLTFKALEVGYQPELILSGRRLNDHMGRYIASTLVKQMIVNSIIIKRSNVLIMGLTFKENCPDLRNTKVIDIVNELNEYGVFVDCYDPNADPNEAEKEYGIKLIDQPISNKYDAIVIAVAHDEFLKMGIDKIKSFGKGQKIIYDLKYLFSSSDSTIRL
jgi:UDP-N-acetyl-D-galactosamine dehydrogenase